jgi:hypothetical protein
MPSQQDLDFVLGKPAYVRKLHAFMKTRHRENWLELWLAIQDYKKKPNKTKAINMIDSWVLKKGTAADGITEQEAYVQEKELLDVKEDYEELRSGASGMGFFKRHWTAGQRIAAANHFDSIEARMLKLIHGILGDFFESQEGQPIDKELDRIGYKALKADRKAALANGGNDSGDYTPRGAITPSLDALVEATRPPADSISRKSFSF